MGTHQGSRWPTSPLQLFQRPLSSTNLTSDLRTRFPWSTQLHVSQLYNFLPYALALSFQRVINFKFPCSLNRIITSHSMKNLGFHSLLRWTMIILPIPTTSLIHLSLKGWETVTWKRKCSTTVLCAALLLSSGHVGPRMPSQEKKNIHMVRLKGKQIAIEN